MLKKLLFACLLTNSIYTTHAFKKPSSAVVATTSAVASSAIAAGFWNTYYQAKREYFNEKSKRLIRENLVDRDTVYLLLNDIPDTPEEAILNRKKAMYKRFAQIATAAGFVLSTAGIFLLLRRESSVSDNDKTRDLSHSFPDDNSSSKPPKSNTNKKKKKPIKKPKNHKVVSIKQTKEELIEQFGDKWHSEYHLSRKTKDTIFKQINDAETLEKLHSIRDIEIPKEILRQKLLQEMSDSYKKANAYYFITNLIKQVNNANTLEELYTIRDEKIPNIMVFDKKRKDLKQLANKLSKNEKLFIHEIFDSLQEAKTLQNLNDYKTIMLPREKLRSILWNRVWDVNISSSSRDALIKEIKKAKTLERLKNIENVEIPEIEKTEGPRESLRKKLIGQFNLVKIQGKVVAAKTYKELQDIEKIETLRAQLEKHTSDLENNEKITWKARNNLEKQIKEAESFEKLQDIEKIEFFRARLDGKASNLLDKKKITRKARNNLEKQIKEAESFEKLEDIEKIEFFRARLDGSVSNLLDKEKITWNARINLEKQIKNAKPLEKLEDIKNMEIPREEFRKKVKTILKKDVFTIEEKILALVDRAKETKDFANIEKIEIPKERLRNKVVLLISNKTSKREILDYLFTPLNTKAENANNLEKLYVLENDIRNTEYKRKWLFDRVLVKYFDGTYRFKKIYDHDYGYSVQELTISRKAETKLVNDILENKENWKKHPYVMLEKILTTNDYSELLKIEKKL